MRHLRKLLEFSAIAVNLAIGGSCLALGLLGQLSGGDMFVPLIPVAPESVASALLMSGAFGILGACMAMQAGGWNRLPMVLWSVGLVLLVGSTVFRSSFRFDGLSHFTSYGWIFLASLVLLLAAWLRFRSGRSRAKAVLGYRR